MYHASEPLINRLFEITGEIVVILMVLIHFTGRLTARGTELGYTGLANSNQYLRSLNLNIRIKNRSSRAVQQDTKRCVLRQVYFEMSTKICLSIVISLFIANSSIGNYFAEVS